MKFDSSKTIFLIDGSSFLYRAYYGLRPLNTPKGEPVQAVYGFCRVIKKLINEFKPGHVALVWDSKGKTTRHEMFADYKANRDAPPSDLFVQKEYIVKFADLIGLKQVAQVGLEADDIMYSLAKELQDKSNKIILVTSDKDMGQAINSNVVLYDAFKEEMVDVEMLEAKMGFAINRLPLYFSLLGDSSDNIPGVRGIGKKGAAELAQCFSSLEDVYENIEKVTKNRTRLALEEQKEKAFLSRDLFLLQYHKTGLQKQDLSFNMSSWQNARAFFAALNFKTFLKDMPVVSAQLSLFSQPSGDHPEDEQKPLCTSVLVTQKDQLEAVVIQLKDSSVIALDTETKGVRPLVDDIVGISVAVKEREAFYIPFGHETQESQLPKEEVVAALKPILEDESKEKWLHNAKFDALVLSQLGITLNGIAFDSMLAASLLFPSDGRRLGLKSLSQQLFDETMLSYQEVVKANKYKNFAHVPLSLAAEYAAVDAHQTYKISKKLKQELYKDKALKKLYGEVEHPILNLLISMEKKGILLDVEQLENLGVIVAQELKNLYTMIINSIDPMYANINLNSPKQVEELLFTSLQLPPQKRTAKKTGYSTDAETLQALAKLHEVPKLLLKYRELYKLKSTYIDALPTYVNQKTNAIHTTYSQIAVATGRLSSFDPNLQNIPVGNKNYGADIRKAFKAREGRIFIAADYSQIELRVLAFLSKDSSLENAFLNNIDIHSQTAAHLFEKSTAEISHEERQIGKRINFSILYGLTPFGLSKDLNIPFAEAKKYIEAYFAQYPQVASWMEKVIDFAKKQGYVETHWGRRRATPGIYERNKGLYEEAKRVAVNTVVQGTAAEIMKIGMFNLQKALTKENLEADILLQIHDELVVSVAEKHAAKAEAIIRKSLEEVVSWDIPLQVTTRTGKNWQEASK